MRISDWSSDVCSSDLVEVLHIGGDAVEQPVEAARPMPGTGRGADLRQPAFTPGALAEQGVALEGEARGDRKSVVEGKSVSVRVDLGGRSIITKKNIKNIIETIF